MWPYKIQACSKNTNLKINNSKMPIVKKNLLCSSSTVQITHIPTITPQRSTIQTHSNAFKVLLPRKINIRLEEKTLYFKTQLPHRDNWIHWPVPRNPFKDARKSLSFMGWIRYFVCLHLALEVGVGWVYWLFILICRRHLWSLRNGIWQHWWMGSK